MFRRTKNCREGTGSISANQTDFFVSCPEEDASGDTSSREAAKIKITVEYDDDNVNPCGVGDGCVIL